MPAGLGAPKLDPPLERRGRPLRGRAEQVQMIRQDDPAPHEPEVRLAPATCQEIANVPPRQKPTPLVHADRNELKDGLIWKFQRGQMRKAVATRFARDRKST